MSLILDCYEDQFYKAVLTSEGLLIVKDKDGHGVFPVTKSVVDYFFPDEQRTKKSKHDTHLWAMQRASDILTIQLSKAQRRIAHYKDQKREQGRLLKAR